jgi:hypothetical protein
MNKFVPKTIFIIPYRDRENQKNLFIRQMHYVLEDIPEEDYDIYFSEQCDTRDFNRGAMKNIGFLAMKLKYPYDYKNITFVFNDVDTMPYQKNLLNYQTTPNIVKHFFGYNYTLGGIVSILGQDFEKTLGFPNLWSWGFEDNLFQKRVLDSGLQIDRGQFYVMGGKDIIQLSDEMFKTVNREEFDRYRRNTDDGIHTIQSLDYTIDEENQTIRINRFNTPFTNNSGGNTLFNIQDGKTPFKNERKSRFGSNLMKMAIN